MKNCSNSPKTGFFRDECCRTGPSDIGTHIICAQVTEQLLNFSKTKGNDLTTPSPELEFPGLSPGDSWCLCIGRWTETLEEGVAPPIDLEATHESALQYVSFEVLEKYSLN